MLCLRLQVQCKPSAIECIRIAEAPPELADEFQNSSAKVRRFPHPHNPNHGAFRIPHLWYFHQNRPKKPHFRTKKAPSLRSNGAIFAYLVTNTASKLIYRIPTSPPVRRAGHILSPRARCSRPTCGICSCGGW